MEPLELLGANGCSAQCLGTLRLTRDGSVLHALGSSVVLRDPRSGSNAPPQILGGHSNEVTCLAVSPSGRFLASGQLDFLGVPARVLVRDLAAQGRVAHELVLHKAKVQVVGFSCDERYVATLGGEDDGNVAIWDLETGGALAGSPAATGFVRCLAFLHGSPTKFVTAGQASLRIWEYDAAARKLRSADVALGTTTRNFTALEVDPSDRLLYAGTSSGDIVQVNLQCGILRNSGPAKGGAAQGGITALKLLPREGKLVCGGGAGTFTVLAVDADLAADPKSLKKFATVASAQISEHAVTSLELDPALSAPASGRYAFYCSTAGSELYRVTLSLGAGGCTVGKELLQTAHPGPIHDLAFPHGYGEVFATCSRGEVRVWHLPTLKQLLRMQVPNVDCRCVAFAQDGKSIISGWADGRIRAWGPQSGKLLWTIHGAHPSGVTSIAGTPDSSRVLSGGEDGTVRVWRIGRDSQVLEQSMKEHKAAINCIAVREDGQQCASASSDGSAIIWDLRSYHRVTQLLDTSLIRAVAFHPDGSEVVTAGTDKRITYWDARSGEPLRRLEATQGEAVNCLALAGDGSAMVSGASDHQLKGWGFDDGRCYFVGAAHAGSVTQVKVTYDKKHVVSVGADGAIMVWRWREPPACERRG